MNINQELRQKWVDRVGGIPNATVAIMKKTQWSPSKSEKVARGTYHSDLDYLGQKAMSELTGYKMSDLFSLGGDEDEDGFPDEAA